MNVGQKLVTRETPPSHSLNKALTVWDLGTVSPASVPEPERLSQEDLKLKASSSLCERTNPNQAEEVS